MPNRCVRVVAGVLQARTAVALRAIGREEAAPSTPVRTWTTDATHPALPGVVVHGTAVIEWLEGERFLINRARADHLDFPDSISIVGITVRDRVDNPRNSGGPTAVTESRL